MKRIILSTVTAACLLLLCSCSFSGTESHKGELAIFYSDLANEYVSGVKKQLDSLLDSSGVKHTSYNAAGSEDSMEKQIEDAIKNGAKAVIVDANDDDISEHTVEIASKKELPVIFFGTNLENNADNYKKAAFVEMERRDVNTDYAGTAKTILKILDNIIKGDEKFKDIDERYHDGNMTVVVPSLE